MGRISEFDMLMVRTRKCRNCGKELHQSYFSLSLVSRGVDFKGRRAFNLSCNTCIVRAYNNRGRRMAPKFISDPGDPRGQGACADSGDPELFAPETKKAIERQAWKQWCDSCPVRELCGQWGEKLKAGGVWGGQFRPWDEET